MPLQKPPGFLMCFKIVCICLLHLHFWW